MMSACVVRFLLLALLGASTPLVVQSELSKVRENTPTKGRTTSFCLFWMLRDPPRASLDHGGMLAAGGTIAGRNTGSLGITTAFGVSPLAETLGSRMFRCTSSSPTRRLLYYIAIVTLFPVEAGTTSAAVIYPSGAIFAAYCNNTRLCSVAAAVVPRCRYSYLPCDTCTQSTPRVRI